MTNTLVGGRRFMITEDPTKRGKEQLCNTTRVYNEGISAADDMRLFTTPSTQAMTSNTSTTFPPTQHY
jgi:hypothetical protein